MFRFNLSRIVPCIVALVFVASGCSSHQQETTKGEAPSSPDTPSAYQKPRWESQQDYLKCPDGASLRLMYKWLRVPHEGTLPDRCMSLDEAVGLVGHELPKLKASINTANAKIEADWAAFQVRVDNIMRLNPNVAVRQLLDIRCNDKSVDALNVAALQWTPFLGTTPDAVRAAIDRIKKVDDEGYGVELNVGRNDGTSARAVYDSYWYERTIEGGPNYEDEKGFYKTLSRSEIYGDYGSKPYQSLAKAFYDGMRLRATDLQGLPIEYVSGPFC